MPKLSGGPETVEARIPREFRNVTVHAVSPPQDVKEIPRAATTSRAPRILIAHSNRGTRCREAEKPRRGHADLSTSANSSYEQVD